MFIAMLAIAEKIIEITTNVNQFMNKENCMSTK